LCGASCHSIEELRRAEALGVDFVVLGPVRATPSHPDAVPLGWERFREIAAGAAVPVYALGGIVPSDLEQGMSCGAHGIAMVRGSWGSGEKPRTHPSDPDRASLSSLKRKDTLPGCRALLEASVMRGAPSGKVRTR